MAGMLQRLFEAAPMLRCECTDLSFAEIARCIDGGQAFDEIARGTGCGQNCTACLPDLVAFLSARQGPR